MLVLDKAYLRKQLAADWKRHYRISFLESRGFFRKVCENCGRGFWTLDTERKRCPDQPCSVYEFLGSPPSKKRFDYVDAWLAIERFFKKEGHTALRRYPVVCRWYPLYFTIAGIIDFYRMEDKNLVFDFPANPVVVPQFCLRFNDIPNVGVTGKHYTCFVMVQQSSVFDPKATKQNGGYWKERCIELDFNMLRSVFKIPEKEIVFLEDLWAGPAAYGPSLEYFVRGLELGNAVFTEFLIRPDGTTTEMPQKVIDMGAGLERFSWLSRGTPTSYDVTFEPIITWLKRQTGVTYDKDLFLRYSKLAGLLNFDEVPDVEAARGGIAKQLGLPAVELRSKIAPLEALYAIADHTSSLAFAIADGALPSNVGGGYNLRVILRRALAFLDKYGWRLDLAKIAELHARHLKRLAPELKEALPQVQKIFDVEAKRYRATRDRARNIVDGMAAKNKVPAEEELMRLYESDGVTPELIRESLEARGIKLDVPADFYVKLTAKHMTAKEEEEEIIDVSGLPPTRTLFYDNERMTSFKAKVLKIIRKHVVLDKTAFYARAGGQEPDYGTLGGARVLDVRKQGGVIVHTLAEEPSFKTSDTVQGEIDWKRRWRLMQHHTATHIINAAARKILGPHVWQHSAFKEEDHARLDITHYDTLTTQQEHAIEELANKIVAAAAKVKKSWVGRDAAEKMYGFGLYQGGAAPAKTLRVVSINKTDVEACGGTHLDSTKEVGLIKILRSKRIQDGVVRIEFAAGEPALENLKAKAALLSETAAALGAKEKDVPAEVEKLFVAWKGARKELRELKR